MKDVGGAGFAGSSPPWLGRERAAIDVERKVGFTENTAMRHRRGDVGPERRGPRYHQKRLRRKNKTEILEGSLTL